jgi:hypothetical protein
MFAKMQVEKVGKEKGRIVERLVVRRLLSQDPCLCGSEMI